LTELDGSKTANEEMQYSRLLDGGLLLQTNLHRKYKFFRNFKIWSNVCFHILLIEIIKAANAVDDVTGI
jgi:hypothetical protein